MNYNSWSSGFIVLLAAVLSSIVFFVFWRLIFTKRIITPTSSNLKNKIRYPIIVGLLFFLFYLDFLRDYVFKNLEQRMIYMQRIFDSNDPSLIVDYTDINLINILGQLSLSQAYFYKYLFFGAFTMLYFTISSIILKLSYPTNTTTKFVSFLYGVGISSMLVIFSLYFFPWNQEVKNGFYLISMEIGHFFQSSLPTLLLLVSFKIYQNYPTENTR